MEENRKLLTINRMKLLLRQLLFLSVIAVCFYQCGTSAKITTADTSQLDPNFAGYKGVLLIIRNYDNKTGYNAIDRTLLKSFKKNYRGEFEMISNKDLDKYTDLDKYRFLVRSNLYSRRIYGNPPSNEQSSELIMTDRKTGKEYKTKAYPGYSALEDFSIVFEALRSSK